ncbi:bacillithiol biosynthesis cysteine-adding enzyme BshC [Occallatibacter savannae]|uniref:bacillithiol biosynthesis cysteine-adding enzyme BshC n=1 Tax=Occallatibacter savannae TaxID=1002691 RepID=UPI000D69EE93|nr:bacillithiol biosynthesis cysteine-adding enzyme BshC [Occallatibacter savannae]
MPSSDCFPIDVVPGQSRLFLDYCAAAPAVRPFYPSLPRETGWQQRCPRPDHWSEIVDILATQNPSASAPIAALRAGAATVLTGQQVGLFGGPLYTPFKAATALARARQATNAGQPHAAIFWLATEDHDFAEINHVVFPSRKELRKLVYSKSPAAPVPAGGVVIDEAIEPLVDQAWELLGASDAMDALVAAYKPGRTFGQAFADFYSRAFADQGLLILDASSAEIHRLGSPVLKAAIERGDELHAALLDRNKALEAAGYHVQVAVTSESSLLFLLDERTGARLSLKRTSSSTAEPQGLWQAGRDRFTTADLLGILAAEPHRISPAALLRPIFQDYLLGTSLIIGGPAEIAYFAQSAVLYERILGRTTAAEPRLSATLIEPAIAELLHKHDLGIDRIFRESADSLAQILAARAMPVEGKQKLSSAGNALDAELQPLLDYMRAMDPGLGRSAETAASKMRYQMNRLRRLAANFEMQREGSLRRHADAIERALNPGGVLQERVHGAAYYLARYGFELNETLTGLASDPCPGHKAVWL